MKQFFKIMFASIAAMILTTEALVTEIPEEAAAPPMPPPEY